MFIYDCLGIILQAVQLLLVGKVKEALTKISVALETNPAVPEYHVFRYKMIAYFVNEYSLTGTQESLLLK
jgi:hypothetical protein